MWEVLIWQKPIEPRQKVINSLAESQACAHPLARLNPLTRLNPLAMLNPLTAPIEPRQKPITLVKNRLPSSKSH